MSLIHEALLDQKLGDLEQARSWSPRLVSKLETMIRAADDYTLFRINPIQYATEKNLSENEAIDLFLYGTKFGLFEMEWHLVCAYCGSVVESLRELSRLHSHFMCTSCYSDNEVSLDDYIQVTFTIAPPIRDIIFHHPDELSPEDYYARYVHSRGVLPSHGMTYEQVFVMLTKLMADLGPGEKRTFELDLGPGMFQTNDTRHDTSFIFFINEAQGPGVQNVPFKLVEGKFQAVGRAMGPFEHVLNGIKFHYPQTGQLASGKIVIELENLMSKKSSLWMFQYPPGFIPEALDFEPCLSGKRLLTTQTFRDLFRSEIVQTEEGIGVKDITFLFTDLKGSTAMYEQIGDPKAFFLVRQHFDTLGRVIAENSGAIVKTIGDAVMASFSEPADAVRAAVGILNDIEEFNRNISQKLILKIGIHRGHSIVVTLNDRLDYFGQTVNIAARVQGLAEAGEIYLTEEVYGAPGVEEVVAACEVLPEAALVKGVSEKINVYKVIVRKQAL